MGGSGLLLMRNDVVPHGSLAHPSIRRRRPAVGKKQLTKLTHTFENYVCFRFFFFFFSFLVRAFDEGRNYTILFLVTF
jgi:hypothetical protein